MKADTGGRGLFQGHLARGRSLFEHGQHAEAALELEEACLLRPRETTALNLLGLAYFRLGRHAKAEEIYRKLIAQNPEAATLHYNLGLIYYKQGRHADAESAFLKSLELSGSNAKVHYYLGSIYEQLKRFQDAIHQYRLAGSSPHARFRIPPAPKPARKPSSETRPVPVMRNVPSGDDTAEFRTAELKAPGVVVAPDTTLPPKTIEPLSRTLLAEDAPGREAPAAAQPPAPRGRPAPAPADGAQLGPFRLLEGRLLQAAFDGKLFIKQGTLYSYSGSITFWVKDKRPGGTPALVIVTGAGKLLLKDKDLQPRLLPVAGGRLFVEPSRVLACEESLNPRYVSLGAHGAEVLCLEGSGSVALSASGAPLRLQVTPDEPVAVPLRSVITWQGALEPQLLEDDQLRDVLASADDAERVLVRLQGEGVVDVEKSVG